jgi:peptide deformylase
MPQILPIVKYGVSKILEQPSMKVIEFGFKDKNNQLDTLAENMFATMYAAKGVGLAAPQIGIMLRVAVIDISSGEDPNMKLVLVNPEITERRGTMTVEEGCLSVPGKKETIERSAEVAVQYQDTKGQIYTVGGKGLLSQALQHEIDHLDGKLFLSYVSI